MQTALITAKDLKRTDIIVMKDEALPPIKSVEITNIFEPAMVEITFETGHTATAAVKDEVRIVNRG